MARSIWKGVVSFGLVTVPVALYPATERREELRFRLLHAKDSSPVEYRRVCKEEGVEVPWDEIVKGYEYEKGSFVIMTDEDFAKARTPATQTIDVRDSFPASRSTPCTSTRRTTSRPPARARPRPTPCYAMRCGRPIASGWARSC